MRLTCNPEPNLVGSKHSCSIDAFKQTPNHFLKLELHPKKKWHNYHMVLEKVHLSWTLHIALKSHVWCMLALVHTFNRQNKITFSFYSSHTAFCLYRIHHAKSLTHFKVPLSAVFMLSLSCCSLWCDVINCGVPGWPLLGLPWKKT